ncbi:unnamed protein product [Adineta steineri]|uniref:BPTI/Kunitz inhibitor domain-containing protein n=1 Tax=Adineta steineri TaxID=433720 RepID=A0A815LNC4_9BILA|nr:unnamed protein product [Adineta steineri]CAF3854379.1 unnamed protein product [Adineta steineri]
MIRLLTVLFVVIGFIYTLESQALASNDKTCKPLNCGGKIKTCPYGYHKQDGCEICKCYDPCNPPGKPILCGPNKRCFVEKLSNGTFVGRCGLPKSKRNTSICEEEKVVGLCKAAFPRFYYNSTIKTCEHFIYGGCGANNNNFDTKEKCETACSQT